MATITISNIFFLSQGSSHNNIVKLQSDNIRDKKIIFLVLDHLNYSVAKIETKNFTNIFSEVNFYIVVLIFFLNTWKFILKQLVASDLVITSLYSLRLRLNEYWLVITSPSATNC